MQKATMGQGFRGQRMLSDRRLPGEECVSPKNPGGRPRKFAEPSRPITVTLPERTLDLLRAVHEDRAKAITKVTDVTLHGEAAARPLVRLVEIEPGTAVLIVGPSRRLREIPWLSLAEIAPAQHLLAIPSGTPPERLELALVDLIDSLAGDEDYERRLLEELRRQIARLRREQRMSTSEIILVDTRPAGDSSRES